MSKAILPCCLLLACASAPGARGPVFSPEPDYGGTVASAPQEPSAKQPSALSSFEAAVAAYAPTVGGLTATQVSTTLDAAIDCMRSCLAVDPSLSGDVRIELVVAPEGHVAGASIRAVPASIEACAKVNIAAVRFPIAIRPTAAAYTIAVAPLAGAVPEGSAEPPGDEGSVDALMLKATGGGGPSRGDVAIALAGACHQLAECGGSPARLVPVRLHFWRAGDLSKVLPATGWTEDDGVLACVTSALGQARVPPFDRRSFIVQVPLQIGRSN